MAVCDSIRKGYLLIPIPFCPTTNYILVVVVVGNAMEKKGEKVTATTFVTKRTESKTAKIYDKVSLEDADIQAGDRVWCELYRLKGKGPKKEKLADWKSKVHSDGKRVTIQKSVVEENGLLPGEECELKVYRVTNMVESNDDGERNESTSDFKEQIDEMHDMISELYDAYTEVKND